MKHLILPAVVLSVLLFPLLLFPLPILPSAYAGSTIDTEAVAPLASTQPDCDKKIASLTADFESQLQAKDKMIEDLKAEISLIKGENAGLKEQLASLSAKEPPAVEEAEEPSPSWIAWIVALILAIVGFFIGRGTHSSPGNQPKNG